VTGHEKNEKFEGAVISHYPQSANKSF